jgi:hypothetical protein
MAACLMDLNSAVHEAECGVSVRDDRTMAPDWTVRWVAEDKLLYYFRPNGERAHRVRFTDAQRASPLWRAMS